MDLTLTIIEAPENVNMLNHTKAFRAEGGSFGRSDSNNWVLPDNDRVVSSRHAEISFQDGNYYLTDLSTNGTFHNGSDNAIGSEQPVALKNGDILSVGDYKLKATVKAQPQAPELPKGLQTADFLDSEDKTTFTAAAQNDHEKLSQAKELDDWLDLGAPSTPTDRSASWGSVSNQPNTVASSLNSAPVMQSLTNDPLSALGVLSDSPTPQSSVDPLAALDHAANIAPPTPPAWEDEDDWWKDGSDSDHAPAFSHALNTPSQQPPALQPTAPPSTAVPSTQQTHSEWDNQPHLQNIPAADVNHAMGMDPAQAPTHRAAQHQPVAPQQRVQPEVTGLAGDMVVTQSTAHPAGSINQLPPESQYQQAPVQPMAPQQSIPHQPEPHFAAQMQVNQTTNTQPAMNPVANNHTAAELATALGIPGLQAQHLAQLVPEASAIINETVNRLIDLLRARSSIKNELRVQRTMIQTTDNNPLKFSASAPDAIKAMFSAENQAFMRPQDAIKDSFDDLSDHQVAVLAGMRAAYDAMLKHFNPGTLDKRFNNQGSLLTNKKAKNWEAFEEHYAMLQRDGEASYDLLFGESFATSYEKQLSELKTARSLTRSRG